MSELEKTLKPLVKRGLFAKDFQKVEAQGVNKVLAILNNLDPGKAAEVKRQLQLQPA